MARLEIILPDDQLARVKAEAARKKLSVGALVKAALGLPPPRGGPRPGLRKKAK